jgi:hypothetical protein
MTDTNALVQGALDWLLDSARPTDTGLTWPDTRSSDELNLTLYNGTAGTVLTLLEAHRHFGDDRYADAALRGARSIAAGVDAWESSGLYTGVAGLAVALHGVHGVLGDTEAGTAARHALDVLRSRFDGERWGAYFDVIGGNAGIALAALAVGDHELATLAVTPYPRTAEPTAHGVTWEWARGRQSRLHHMSHGTLGIAYSLAAVGRADLLELALAGVADVVARDEDGPAGFLVPHSEPMLAPDIVSRYNYGWCHGPTGDAQAFRLFGAVTGDPVWRELADRCWHTVVHSGVPQRLRPGFWDNNGHCCGTAGVLALACDRHVEQGADLDFAGVLVADLAARATVDADGVRWSNLEHRQTPSELEPTTGWAMGNAGIVRELLRYLRITTGGDPAYAVRWPDQPAVS